MYTMLGLVGIFTTTLGSVTILLNASMNSKVDMKENKYKLVKTSKGRKIVGDALQLIPGVSLLNMTTQEKIIEQKIDRELRQQENIETQKTLIKKKN